MVWAVVVYLGLPVCLRFVQDTELWALLVIVLFLCLTFNVSLSHQTMVQAATLFLVSQPVVPMLHIT